MAHGDYACCACCDCKMYYDACSEEVKTQLCADCAAGLTLAAGRPIASGNAVIAWLKERPADALAALSRHGYSPCFYSNAVDAAVKVATIPTPNAAPATEGFDG